MPGMFQYRDAKKSKIPESAIIAQRPMTESEKIRMLRQKSDLIVSIDGGASKTLLQLIDPNTMAVLDLEIEGEISNSLITGPTNINVVGLAETLQNLKQLFTKLNSAKIGPNKRKLSYYQTKSIVCGLAGLVANVDKKAEILNLFAKLGFAISQVSLSGDVDLAKELINENGAILIAGTGSICFSKHNGKETRIGGYGYVLGDGGSGFYIGKLALSEAFDAHFQDKKPFALTPKFCQLLNVSAINEVIRPFYAGSLKPADIARITPFVFEAAFKDKDPACMAIIDKAAKELAEHIAIALKNNNETNFPIFLIGGVFKNENANAFIGMIIKHLQCDLSIDFRNIADENMVLQVLLRQVQMDNNLTPMMKQK